MIRITDKRFVRAVKKVCFDIHETITFVHVKSGKIMSGGVLTDGNVLIVPENGAVKIYNANEFEVLY